MIIVIESFHGNGDSQTIIKSKKIEDNVFITTEYINYIDTSKNTELTIVLSKDELHGFIGGLLHLQSKFGK